MAGRKQSKPCLKANLRPPRLLSSQQHHRIDPGCDGQRNKSCEQKSQTGAVESTIPWHPCGPACLRFPGCGSRIGHLLASGPQIVSRAAAFSVLSPVSSPMARRGRALECSGTPSTSGGLPCISATFNDINIPTPRYRTVSTRTPSASPAAAQALTCRNYWQMGTMIKQLMLWPNPATASRLLAIWLV
jgi:hypothetical protein